MKESWLESEHGDEPARQSLRSGLTRVGGPRADIGLPDSGEDELQIWDAPPRVVFVGRGERPQVNGIRAEEVDLRDGDVIHWHAQRWTFRQAIVQAHIEEIHAPPDAGAPAGAAVPGRILEERIKSRLYAGILAELGAADAAVVRRWQDAVLRGAFDADACTQELCMAPSRPDARVDERSAALLRDLLMSGWHRSMQGNVRRVRETAKHTLAWLLVQALVLAAFALVLLVVLIFARLHWGTSFDALVDRAVDFLSLGR